MSPTDTAQAEMTNFRYHAFISYSHAADGRLAPAFQAGLQRLAKPWYRLRAMRVFRDQTGLAVTPRLWESIKNALCILEYFILLASPTLLIEMGRAGSGLVAAQSAGEPPPHRVDGWRSELGQRPCGF